MNYGGDEVQAIVLDIGADTTRAGYAGDDGPKAVFPTAYGFTVNTPAEGTPMEEAGQTPTTLHIGEDGPSFWRPRMEVSNPIQNGLISDFAPIPAIISHALNHSLRVEPTEHPILVTEPAWNSQTNRERMAEIMFEEFRVPAFYIANTGVLNAFTAGRHTALVVDIGKQTASVLPVVEGFVLRKGVTQSALPQLLHANSQHYLTQATSQRPEIDLTPRQLIYQKQPVELHQPPQFELRDERLPHTTESWKLWAHGREVDEWIGNVAGVLEQSWSDQFAQTKPAKSYEFPTGYRTIFGPDRFLPQRCTSTNLTLRCQSTDTALPNTLTQLVTTSLKNCENDIRAPLVSSIVVTGGGSLLPGVLERLNNDLIRAIGTKVKVQAAGNVVERRFGAWIGGSILASLGTFHQLWISSQEWQACTLLRGVEHGRAIVGQRCK
ncbi:brg1-associated factor b [Auriculariales sp. MPI-PUGE-AT-0066]|nr:brg1-associated factor b [Auriculariales sp. MPI-PUGE-AT-0066]